MGTLTYTSNDTHEDVLRGCRQFYRWGIRRPQDLFKDGNQWFYGSLYVGTVTAGGWVKFDRSISAGNNPGRNHNDN